VKVLVISLTDPWARRAHIGVESEYWGMVRRIRWTARPQRRIGQRTRSPVRRWVRASILVPFFWSSKTTVRNSALESREGSECGITCFRMVRKIKLPRVTRLVRPAVGVSVYLQDRMAKKKAPMMMSAAWSYSLALSFRRWESWKRRRRSLGVMAF
jgi:hypothetical protein